MPGQIKKPLGSKSYDAIPYIPGSRTGTGDQQATNDHVRIATVKTRDRYDRVIVTEKLDGIFTCIAKIGSDILSLNRAGYRCATSPYESHRLFAAWVDKNRDRFADVLHPGERICGEWLAQASGTLYDLKREPFVAFDLAKSVGKLTRASRPKRQPYRIFRERAAAANLATAHVLHDGDAIGVAAVMDYLVAHQKNSEALDRIEGAVWRVERRGAVDFLLKFVDPTKVPGQYLPELSGKPPLWQWKPGRSVQVNLDVKVGCDHASSSEQDAKSYA